MARDAPATGTGGDQVSVIWPAVEAGLYHCGASGGGVGGVPAGGGGGV
jgi:hypothetical protein